MTAGRGHGEPSGDRPAAQRHARPPSAGSYDAIVIGGGPAGSTFARRVRSAGWRVLMVERAVHPRFAIGESLIPCTLPILERLHLVERLEAAGFLRKYAAYFCFADGRVPQAFWFGDSAHVPPHAYGVERAKFDHVLWTAAVETGVEGIEGASVLRVCFDGGRAVGAEIQLADGTRHVVASRLVADCSGRTTLLARQLGLRDRDPLLDNVALYRHYEGVRRSIGADEGTIAIVAVSWGWMWLIPLAGALASVGAVVRSDWYRARRRRGASRDEIWEEILADVPAVSVRLAGAVPVRPVETTADFQYRARRLAGDGWVLVGDAGAFLDPVFSSGVHLAMVGAETAAGAAVHALARQRPVRARDFVRYARSAGRSFDLFSRLVYAWYDPAFRRVFIRPPGKGLGVPWLRREVVRVLAGDLSAPWRARFAVQALLVLASLERRRRVEG